MKISYSFGIVDLLHYGHIKAFIKAKKKSDLHIFGLIKDNAIIDWFGQLLSTYEERKQTLECLTNIDEIIPQDTFDCTNNLKKIHEKYPDAQIILYRGSNWKILPSEEFLKSINCKIEIIPYYKKLSPENIYYHLKKDNNISVKRSDIISTKANTLINLQKKLKKSKIEDILVVTEAEFNKNKIFLSEKIKNKFKGKKVIVRSSCSMEDGFQNSNAGCFESILNVNSKSKKEIENAIKKVADSYEKVAGMKKSDEQILIQTQTDNIKCSGVIFTRDIQENRPYYLINYDDNGSTDSVTSGVSNKTIRILRSCNSDCVEKGWKSLLSAVREIENILTDVILDIEFAIKNDGEIVIFQVRPLAANYKYKKEDKEDNFNKLIYMAKSKYLQILDAYSNKPMMYSDMAFWNPAEIIGSNPKNLDYSLYKEIITSCPWNEGLVPMGYKEVKHNLMQRFANKPYISLDYSFRSLTLASFNERITNKLIEFYKKKLKNNLNLHDKIEFEIVLSSLDFETDDKLNELKDNGFNQHEIKEIKTLLHGFTQDALNKYFTVLTQDLKSLSLLEKTRQNVQNKIENETLTFNKLINYFKILISSLKINGTPQFARQARYAFIAKSFCKTLVSKSYIPFHIMTNFMLGIDTVAGQFTKDFELFLNNKISPDEFNLKYGHLRAGTYDITSPVYSDINFIKEYSKNSNPQNFCKYDKSIDENLFKMSLEKLNLKCDDFVKFLKTSIQQREYFKFEFTKSLSLAIELLAKIANLTGYTRNDFSFLYLNDIYASDYYENEWDLKDFWNSLILSRKEHWELNSQIELPDVIFNESNFYFIKLEQARPNFITDKLIEGQIVDLENDKDSDISGKIVLIEKADPGYDWIFTKNIKGLITKYGGVASHMSIRCSEFNLPAAIGVGEKIFTEISNFKFLKMDCKLGKIKNGEKKVCLV